MRVAVVLARATRHHGDIGRRIALVCPSASLAHGLRTVGLDRSGMLYPSLAAAGWARPDARRRRGEAHRVALDAPGGSETMAGIGT
jgi:hypothetical protein